ncbi:hypothetical protein L7F22_068863 [Adiantum nelumboides]|nr:hypothetical protein [Adiantum nelumboides]
MTLAEQEKNLRNMLHVIRLFKKMLTQENDTLINYFELMPESPVLLYAIKMEETELPRFYPVLYPPHTEPIDQMRCLQIVEEIGSQGWNSLWKMEESNNNTTMLMQRIRQLEQERDELRLDVEQLCMQHSGKPSKVDISSQIQARRITGLEQEMELWKQKLQACTVKNQKLQDELAEAKQIKAHFADLLKSETDKNLELGKEIKHYQGEAATALVERDRAFFQVCGHWLRLNLVTTDLLEQKKSFQSFQDEANVAHEDLQKLHNVVHFFWRIRSTLSSGHEHAQGVRDKVAILLEDSQSSWAFGNIKQELEKLSWQVKESGAAMATMQVELCAAKELAITLQRQLEEEALSKQNAKHSVLAEQKLELIEGKLRSFHSVIAGFKEEIMRMQKAEESWAGSMMAVWMSLSMHMNPISQASEKTTRRVNDDKLFEITDVVDDPEALYEASEKATSSKVLPQQGYVSEMRDTKEALAMALEEKVDALLRLSQQEERHILEENMVAVWGRKNTELRKQLLQVTIDKGHALIQVANLTEELARAQEERCELRHRCQHLPSTGISNNHDYRQKNTPFQWPLKSWFRKHNRRGFRSSAQTSLKTGVKDKASLARLQAENSFLWCILSNLHKLCSSVNRLHQALVKVRSQVSNGCFNLQSNENEQLDFVICEAQRLIVAVGVSLPVDYKNQRQSEITEEDAGDMSYRVFDSCGTSTELLSTIGRTSLEAILFAAEVYKQYVNEQRHY